MTDQETINHLKEEMDKLLIIKNLCEEEMQAFGAELRKIVNENNVLKKKRDELMYDMDKLLIIKNLCEEEMQALGAERQKIDLMAGGNGEMVPAAPSATPPAEKGICALLDSNQRPGI